jgi:hypothetical protein
MNKGIDCDIDASIDHSKVGEGEKERCIDVHLVKPSVLRHRHIPYSGISLSCANALVLITWLLLPHLDFLSPIRDRDQTQIIKRS